MQDGATLVLERVRKDFGGLRAVDDCSFVVETGKIVGLIGPNGAGKTTLFQVISGVLKRDSGHIYFHGDDISRLRPYEIARRGIGRTFQITRIFPKMTVWENMIVASHSAGAEERAREMLELADLLPLKDHYAAELSFGQQKLLDLMRVMMLNPQLILLDEPAAGLDAVSRRIVEEAWLSPSNTATTLVICHRLRDMERFDQIVVLRRGRISECGTHAELLAKRGEYAAMVEAGGQPTDDEGAREKVAC